ncbi:MAG TPA: transposase, partial [Euryarchaeota archaeon]|nr:transposase [Euryarchaeota archaeon]
MSVARTFVHAERVHADWFERDGEKIVLFGDDASRLLTGFGSYQNATAENAKKTLEEAINHFGKPEQLITDHGVQFTSIPRETCPEPRPNEFQRFLKDNEIQHIKARVKHPQTLLRLRSIQR